MAKMRLSALSRRAWLLATLSLLGLGAGRAGLPLWWLWLTIGLVSFAALIVLAFWPERHGGRYKVQLHFVDANGTLVGSAVPREFRWKWLAHRFEQRLYRVNGTGPNHAPIVTVKKV